MQANDDCLPASEPFMVLSACEIANLCAFLLLCSLCVESWNGYKRDTTAIAARTLMTILL